MISLSHSVSLSLNFSHTAFHTQQILALSVPCIQNHALYILHSAQAMTGEFAPSSLPAHLPLSISVSPSNSWSWIFLQPSFKISLISGSCDCLSGPGFLPNSGNYLLQLVLLVCSSSWSSSLLLCYYSLLLQLVVRAAC
jgi:hypothetical protein